MSGFYILFDNGTLEGIDGQLVRQENHNIPNGAPALPDELARSRSPYEISGMKWKDGALTPMTEAEQAAYQAYLDAQSAATEAARQAAKPDAFKQTENDFYDLCHAIFGDYTKRGFDEITAALEAMKETNFNLATELSLKLLGIDAIGKRYNAKWWDDAVRHE